MATMSQQDLENFNAMVRKFSETGLSDEASLGVSGLMAQQMSAIKKNTEALEEQNREERTANRNSSPVRPPKYQQDKGIDQGSLVDQLRLTTFTVKVENAIGTIVDPLYRRMGIISLDERLFLSKKFDVVHSLQRQMLDTSERAGAKNANLLQSMNRKYHEFMRFPVWNSLAVVGKTVLSTVSTLAFGFKKRKSDTDRIVEAIKHQTEFMRTGAIDQTRNLFQQFMRGGLIGTPLRKLGEGIMSGVTGISQKRAQERENRRAQGENVNDLRSRLSTILFLNRLNLRGTQSGAAGGLDEEASAQNTIVKHMATLMEHTKNLSNVVHVQMDTIKDQAVNKLATVMFQATNGNVVRMDRETSKANETMSESVVKMAAGSDISVKQDHDYHNNVVSHQKEEQNFFEDMKAANDDQIETQKKQLKWLKRIRDGQIWAQITRAAQLALSGIKGILGGIAKTLTTIGASVAAMLALRRRGGGIGPGGDIDIDGPNRRNPRRGGLLKRMLEWGKNAVRSPVARRVATVGRAASVPAMAAGGAYMAGKYLAPNRASEEELRRRAEAMGPAPSTASGPAGSLALPNDGGAFERAARRADTEAAQTRDVTQRVTQQARESMSLLGDKLDEVAAGARDAVNSDRIAEITRQATEVTEAQVQAMSQRFDNLSGRLTETARDQMNSMNRRSEQQMGVLETIADTLQKLLRNDEQKMRDGESIESALMGPLGGVSIFGDN